MRFWILFAFAWIGFAKPLPWIPNGQHGMELEFVRPFLPENAVILEAGGHCGEDTVVLAKKWPRGTIYSFEPCLGYFAQLQQAVAPFPNVSVFPFGLYSSTGTFAFYVSQIWKGAASLLEDNHLPHNEYNDVQTSIFCKNLDEWAVDANVSHIDYMWLDMEGVEQHVLASAPRILQTVRAISTEVNFREFRKGMSQFSEIMALLEARGFTLYKIWESPPNTPNWQATAVFVRNELL